MNEFDFSQTARSHRYSRWISVFFDFDVEPNISKIKNEYALENANVQKFIKSTGLHFDVIVAEEFFDEALYMLAHKHKAPMVTISKFSFHNEHHLYVDNYLSLQKRSLWCQRIHGSSTRLTASV